MGRRKWKLYQDGLVPRRSDGERSSDEDTLPDDGPPPAIKIKTIEEINAPEDAAKDEETDNQRPMKKESILASLIQRPATQPKLEYHEEPADWKPADRCYFCVDGEKEEAAPAGGATSPASESDSSSVSGAKSPPAPPLLQHLLQLQAQNPQAIAQFQQMMAALAALGTGLVPPALSQAWLMQRLAQARQHGDGRLPSESNDKVPVEDSSPSMTSEQPLDLSAKSSSTGSPPPVPKGLENSRPKNSADAMSARRAYSEDELAAALRDIQSGRLGTRRAAAVYGIPRSTLRNKVYKLQDRDSDPDSDPERPDAPDSPPSVILKIPTFPLPDERPASPPRAPLLLPPAAFDAPPAPLYASSLSLNDLIAKSISQKLQQPPERDAAFARPDARHVSVIKTPPDGRFPAPGNSRAPNNGQPAGGKGTRPKRGKYRNYDRDSLVEAVKAVQRGEMSVHRAGSYYGVPHSTLEYKVKERHLMRPRKREPKPPQDAKPPPPKPPPPKPGKFTNGLGGGLGAPEGFAAGYPFWAGGFAPAPAAPELYASHMMRRLREEAPPANGSFLEGIIRSSLADQRPGAALLARLADEPAARRARLADGALAADMRAAVQRLRARAASPGPPAGPPPVATPAPPAAPPDRV